MMGQGILFILFIITVLVGGFAYFFPKQHVSAPVNYSVDTSVDDLSPDQSSIKRVQEINMTTNAGVLQINRKVDDLIKEQKQLAGMINDEQTALDITKKEIAEITQQMADKSNVDILRIKTLGDKLQDDQQLLIAHGHHLVDLNNQLNQKRHLLAEQKDLVNINNESSKRDLQEHDSSVTDQSAMLFDRVKQQNDDERQKMEDQMQRIKDQQNR